MAKGHYIPVTAGAPGAGGARRCALIRRAIRTVLVLEGVSVPCEVDVLLTDDGGIRSLNRDMRQVDAPTDVLSFPALELSPGRLPDGRSADPATGLVPLGDMAVNVGRAGEQARAYGHSRARELAYLAVHSTLHLLGYDHLDEGPQKALMREREEAAMRALGLER